jgi:predicted HTH transcriptional regulator
MNRKESGCVSYNPIIVEVLRDYGYVDARGMGVRRKIVPLIREYTGCEASFDATDDFLRTTLPAKRISNTQETASISDPD